MHKKIKILGREFLNLRTIFILILFFEVILFSYFYLPNRYTDLIWHLESGERLISGNAVFKNFFYSPLFSLSAYWVKNNIDNSIGFILINFFRASYIIISSYLLSCLINFKSINKNGFEKNNLLVIFFIFLNPFIIKFLNPLYSDSFAFIAGLLYAFRYSKNSLVFESRFKNLFIDRFILNNKYYLLMLILSFFRYSILIIICASILIDLNQFFILRANRSFIKSFQNLFLFASIIGIIYFSSVYLNNLSEKTNLIFIFLSFVIGTFGFRESFSIDLSSPLNFLNTNHIYQLFASSTLALSKGEIIVSILLGIILTSFSIIGLLQLLNTRNPLLMPFFIGFLLLINAELAIGFASYRYFLLLLPCIIVGLTSTSDCLKKIKLT